MVVFPNAKINLGLNIIGKRSDGYHNLESIFYPIGISDALEINRHELEESTLHIHGLSIPGDVKENLIFKAWEVLQARFNLPHIRIDLIKNIPMGGGVGGGSADCGFMIQLVDAYFSLGLSTADKEELAGTLGSDCPFFIQNKPAYVSGRGLDLAPFAPVLKGVYCVLLYGGMHISTAEAYAGITPQPTARSLKDMLTDDCLTWKNWVKNDFESVVFAKYPLMNHLKEKLHESGAFYASLSGTGSCIYGLYEQRPSATVLGNLPVCWQGVL